MVWVRHPVFALRCRRKGGRWADFARPRDIFDLTQWRKLFDRNPDFVTLLDKIEVKRWTRERWPELEAPETVWVGDTPEELPNEFLAPGYVIKTSHSTNENYFPVREGVDRGKFLKVANRWIHHPRRHWHFWLPVRRRFLAERLIVGQPLVDVSVRVTNGIASIVSCATDFKTKQERIGFFFRDGRRIWSADDPLYDNIPADFAVPACLARTVELAERISVGWDYLRVDFLAVGDAFYLSEITLYPNSGFGRSNWRTEIQYRYWLEALHLSWPFTSRHGWLKSLYFDALKRWLPRRKALLGPAEAFYAERYAAEQEFAARRGQTASATDPG
jgi:hypothetical protein